MQMSVEEIRQRLRGPIAYVTTPFREAKDYPVDEDAFRAQIRFLIDSGIHLVVPCGGTGEFFSLTPVEWRILVEAALRESEGDQITVVPSIGGGVAQAVEMAQAAEKMGCQMVQLTFLDPMFGVTEEGICAYYRQVAESVSIGVMPYRTATFPMSLEVTVRLFDEIGNAVALKEESGDVRWSREFMRVTEGNVPVVCGGGEAMAPYYLLAGAQAFTTGLANLVPHLSLELYRAAVEERWERVFEIEGQLSPLNRLRNKPGRMIPVIKEGLKMMGLADSARTRPPVMPLSRQEREEVHSVLSGLSVPVIG
jgi:4-hydroxy-tetrahydrodipicolinate synthase